MVESNRLSVRTIEEGTVDAEEELFESVIKRETYNKQQKAISISQDDFTDQRPRTVTRNSSSENQTANVGSINSSTKADLISRIWGQFLKR